MLGIMQLNRQARSRTSFLLRYSDQNKRNLTGNASTPSTPKPRSDFELEDAPLFSLRTRIIFFTVMGSAALASVASYWLNADRENAYIAEETSPEFIRIFGSFLGLPVDPNTGRIDRSVLGPRDVRDLVGEKVNLEMQLKSGIRFILEADAMEPFSQVINRTLNGGIDKVEIEATKAAS